MELFKGYIETEGKAARQRFKGADLLTFEQAERLTEYAGVLADDVVLIDFDDAEQADAAMGAVEDLDINCRVYRTTRGRHFLFRSAGGERCGNGKRLACGLRADIKAGSKSSYEILKYDGKAREIERDFTGDGPQEVPCWLRPVEQGPDFRDMEEGQGRNNELFRYILTLQSQGFSKAQCRETLRVVNEHVLPEPLPEDEMEKVTRDEAFQKELFFEKGQFRHDRFGNYLISQFHIIKLSERLHIYDNGVYTSDLDKLEKQMVRCIPNIKKAQRAETLDYIRIMSEAASPSENASLIPFRNGVLNIETGELGPFDEGLVLTNKIPHDYRSGATCEVLDRTLDKMACHDPQIRALLEECAGYCLYRRNELGKSFILTGGKSNGKSTFLDMVTAMLGEPNVASLDLSELGQRFSTVALFGKLANIGDDISDEFLKGNEVSTFKKIVTGSRIKAENKGKDVFEFKPYAKQLFSANEIPRMRDKTGAVLRRLVIIPFDATFSRDDPDFDPYIISKLTTEEAMEALLAMAVRGLQRVLENNGFTESAKVQRTLHDYEVENNPIVLFLEDAGIDGIINETTVDVYRRYTVFCAENNFSTISNIVFTKLVNKHCGTELERRRIDGKQMRIFTKSNRK